MDDKYRIDDMQRDIHQCSFKKDMVEDGVSHELQRESDNDQQVEEVLETLERLRELESSIQTTRKEIGENANNRAEKFEEIHQNLALVAAKGNLGFTVKELHLKGVLLESEYTDLEIENINLNDLLEAQLYEEFRMQFYLRFIKMQIKKVTNQHLTPIEHSNEVYTIAIPTLDEVTNNLVLSRDDMKVTEVQNLEAVIQEVYRIPEVVRKIEVSVENFRLDDIYLDVECDLVTGANPLTQLGNISQLVEVSEQYRSQVANSAGGNRLCKSWFCYFKFSRGTVKTFGDLLIKDFKQKYKKILHLYCHFLI